MSNNFVITGIPRSGTTLLCKLMNHIENVVCMNEIPALYDVPNLSTSLCKARTMLYVNQPIPMNVGNDGEIITDTQRQVNKIGLKKVDIDFSKPMFIGSKINVPYLLQIDSIVRQGLKVISVVRNPVYAIASWNKHANINEQYVMPEDFEKWPRYSTFSFKSENKYERQAELWNYLADIIIKKSSIVVAYESLVDNPKHITTLCAFAMGLIVDRPTKIKKMPELINMNDDSRFEGIDLVTIRNAVNKHCKNAKVF